MRATFAQLTLQRSRLGAALFVPRPGWKMIVADYSQIELRLLAHMAQDERLIAAFESGREAAS